jgi:cysteine desulfurase
MWVSSLSTATGVQRKDCFEQDGMQPRSYLDHNATAPVRPEVAEAVARALEVGGNPSSVHAEGRAARALVEEAREAVAALVSARAWPSRLRRAPGTVRAFLPRIAW